MANYTTQIDRVEQLSNDYSDLKDRYIFLKGYYKLAIEEVNKLKAEISDLKQREIPQIEKIIIRDYDWDIIKKDVRVTQHFKATKESRKKNTLLKKELKLMSDKYYNLLAIRYNNLLTSPEGIGD